MPTRLQHRCCFDSLQEGGKLDHQFLESLWDELFGWSSALKTAQRKGVRKKGQSNARSSGNGFEFELAYQMKDHLWQTPANEY
jgi:hypothetical protein